MRISEERELWISEQQAELMATQTQRDEESEAQFLEVLLNSDTTFCGSSSASASAS